MTALLVSVSQRSLPVLHLIITHYNRPCGSTPEALPPHRSSGARHSHMSIARSTSKSCSLPPGTKYPACLPNNLDLKRIGFVLLQQPSHTSESAPRLDGQQRSSSAPPGPLSSPPMPKVGTSVDTVTSAVSLTTKEKIRLHYQTLMGLRRRRDGDSDSPPSPSQCPARSRVEAKEAPDIKSSAEEEEEEQSQVCLLLSESSSSSEDEGVDGSESTDLQLPLEEEGPHHERGAGALEGEGLDQRQQEERLFAQEYLLRVRLHQSMLLTTTSSVFEAVHGVFSSSGVRRCAGVSRCC